MSADPHKELVRALAAHLGDFRDISGSRTEWASVMFTGMRHKLTFTLPDTPELLAQLAALYETELPMRGHFVADLTVTERIVAGGLCTVTLEALTIEQA